MAKNLEKILSGLLTAASLLNAPPQQPREIPIHIPAGEEIRRDIPLESFRVESVYDEEFGSLISRKMAYLIDFHGTQEQISAQKLNQDAGMNENKTWDIVSFYNLPDNYQSDFNKFSGSIRNGDYPPRATYVSSSFFDRLGSDKKLLLDTSEKLGIKKRESYHSHVTLQPASGLSINIPFLAERGYDSIALVGSMPLQKERGKYSMIEMRDYQENFLWQDVFDFFP